MKSKQEVIKSVNESVSSVFTKEDVVKLIESIKPDKGASITADVIDSIANDIAQRFERYSDDIVSIDSVTVSAGNYGNGVDSVDMSIDESRITDIVLNVFQDYDITADENTAAAENNSTDNQGVI